MLYQGLPPGVKNREKTDFSAEMFGICGNLKKGLRDSLEEDSVDDFFILSNEWIQKRRERENKMEIGNGQEFGLAFVEPSRLSQGLAFGTMAIAAGVVGLFLVAAGTALINMSAELSGAAANQIPDDAMLFKRNPVELVAM